MYLFFSFDCYKKGGAVNPVTKRKCQISIEYLILTGFILLVIIIPSVYFLYTLTSESLGTQLKMQKVDELSNGLIENARYIYYLGLYSKKVVDYEMPSNVENMFIAELVKGPDKFYYIGIFIADENGNLKKNYFLSEVPIKSEIIPDLVDDISIANLIPECESATCSFYNFKDGFIERGNREFKLETVLDGNDIKVSITPISQ
jgi:hypothetical protein